MSDKIISKEGYEKLQKELVYLTKVKRKEIAERIQKAKDMGDLSENAEYSEAKDAHGFNEGRIAEIQETLKNVQIVDESNGNGTVGLGSKVYVSFEGKDKIFTIVSFNEVNPVEGKISNESPLGSAFIGRKKGEKVTVVTPRGKVEYNITNVE